MNAFYSEGLGGALTTKEQALVSLELPPGKYLVYANASVAISKRAAEEAPPGVAYLARLTSDSVEDTYNGGLRYDGLDPGSRGESVALQIAVDLSDAKAGTTVSLKCFGTVDDMVLVWNPRISAIEVSELTVFNRVAKAAPPEEYQYI
jgi:hypothetical protein